MSRSASTPRLVTRKFYAKALPDESGASVRDCIGKSELKLLDPFVTMIQFEVALPKGFANHPHRGFEQVTYILEGGFTSKDTVGNTATVGPGDAQWMTVGRAIIHSEMPAGQGTTNAVQLWISLPAKDKMVVPKSKVVLSKDIPKAQKDGVEVRVIAGESMGVRSSAYTKTPMMFLDFILKPGTQVRQAIPEKWNAFVYTLQGEGTFGTPSSEAVRENHVLVLSNGGDVSVWNKSSKPLRFLLIGGQPLYEPMVQYGPFVMNTQAQIDQTIEDYRQRKNGFEDAKP